MTKKTIIVTGGSRGIGLNIVKTLLLEGYNVISISRNSKNTATEKLKKLYGKRFSSFSCDISKYLLV